ncbi:MAG: sodium:phosphate symporter [Acidimicrobiia bacterium]|nr:MAG: sodium:phosphate symporter [Acidimicrobiia bacterium]
MTADYEGESAPELAGSAGHSRIPPWARLILVLGLLYLFLVGVKLLEVGIKGVSGGAEASLFEGITNPLAALAVGILATVLVQSSSVTTSTIVALVAAGSLPFEIAVPMIMGANIGTTVTNTLVSLGHARRSEEFRLAFTAATMHDFFNLLAVAVILPLELAFGVLSKPAEALAEAFAGSVGGGSFNSPIKGAVKWGAIQIERVLDLLTTNPRVLGSLSLAVGLLIIFLCLIYITKNMRILVAARIERSLNVVLARSGLVGMTVGMIITVAVQSSSITTSILIPLVASGLLLVTNAYPITLGANVGTTVTALLAAFAAGTVDGLAIALVHLGFNLLGILILYPIRAIRHIPIRLAGGLARIATTRKWVAIVYVLAIFVALPLLVIVIF